MTLNNQLYTHKARREAVQFTGTVQNSAEILEWLHARNMQGEVTTLTTTDMVKGKVVRTTSKLLTIHCVTTLGQDGWIVESEEGTGVSFWDNESFQQNFAPVTKTTPV